MTHMSLPPQFSSSFPTIGLPKFNGSVDTWLDFRNLFTSLVHHDPSIPPVRKLFYLKDCLYGDAARVVASIDLSDSNYQIAWNLLKERYDDRKFIRDSYVDMLLDLPSISKEFSVQDFVDCVQKDIRVLQSLGEPVDSWNSILIATLRRKFSGSLRERWEDYSNDIPNPTLQQMLAFLNRRAHLEKTRNQTLSSKSSGAQERSKHPNQQANSRPQKAYMATTSQNRCLFCEGDHYTSNCSKFLALTPHQRYEAARKGSWCNNCLRKGHRTSQCSSSNCRNCQQKHHTLLYFDKQNNIGLKVPEVPASSSPVSSTVALHARSSSEAVLATALVDLMNNHGKIKTCRVFLDAGSQAH
ncbi:uncharacterized protein LOC128668442 [Microplitis demolitor]|uniref:uncharacterized protein LOC128668442 n=1 Tax=Microplitis demolitor TaxID=69319 RepID=UPI00235B6D73|nr:uncharacterized protein LOC128668442 [Microplitis demolitor]